MAESPYDFLTAAQVKRLSTSLGTSWFNSHQKARLIAFADTILAGPMKDYIDSVVIGGVPGPAGPAGPAGPQGIQGLTGATGPAGPQGIQGPPGDMGLQGPQGGTGATGAKGDKGDPGTVWRDGVGAPSNALGANGDYYLERVTGDVYLKTAGVYAVVANIKGPQGPQGPAGVGGGGSGGVYQIGGSGGSGSELAPALSTWTFSGSTPPTYSAPNLVFASASNLAAALATGIATTDTGTYNVTYTISGYAGGGVRLLIYGDNTPNIGSGLTRTANGTYTEQITVIPGSGSQSNQLRFQATGTSGTNTYNISGVSVTESTGGGGGGGVARDMTIKVSEIEVSVIDFGADPTGVVASDAAFAAAIAYSRRIRVPEGIYRLNNTLLFNRTCMFYGDGRNQSIIRSYVSGANHGARVIGETSLGRSNLIELRGFQLIGMGTLTTAGSGPGNGNWSGLYIQRKVLMNNVYINDFTNDGIYYAPSDEAENGVPGTIDNAVFFSRMDNVWSKNNGRDGISVRRGANANSFINCQFDNNGRYGMRHFTDGFSTYGNTIRDGQCSYNNSYGYFFESGTNIVTSGLYAELNGWNGSTGYVNTPIDFYVGDNCVRSWIGIGVLYNASTTHVRLPGFNPNTIQVWEGGRKLFGS